MNKPKCENKLIIRRVISSEPGCSFISDSEKIIVNPTRINASNVAKIITKPKGGMDRLCGLVVSVADYKQRGPGFGSRALLRIFLRELSLERGPLSLVIG
jgi:hypothetical protein